MMAVDYLKFSFQKHSLQSSASKKTTKKFAILTEKSSWFLEVLELVIINPSVWKIISHRPLVTAGADNMHLQTCSHSMWEQNWRISPFGHNYFFLSAYL